MLAYADALCGTPVEVPKALYDLIHTALGDTGTVELTAAIAYENLRARFNRAFEIGSQGFSEGAFCALPAPPGSA